MQNSKESALILAKVTNSRKYYYMNHSNFNYTELKDIPENINAELVRLHLIVMSDILPSTDKEWAKSKIEIIHQLLFFAEVKYEPAR